jgi:hypothetical protein
MGGARVLGRVALMAVLAFGLAVCGRGEPNGFQEVCDHISAAQHAMDDNDVDKAKDEIGSAASWSEAAVEDTSGADRTALEKVLGAMQQARGELDQVQARTALQRADQLCSED